MRVLKSRNILDTGEIIDIENYDSFIDAQTLSKLTISKFYDNDDVYLTPNMTYKPRLIRKSKGYVVNGSIAILIPKDKTTNFSQNSLIIYQAMSLEPFIKLLEITKPGR